MPCWLTRASRGHPHHDRRASARRAAASGAPVGMLAGPGAMSEVGHMTGRSRVSLFARHGRPSRAAGICAVLILGAWAITVVAAPGAWAQSPRYTVKMQDFAPGAGYPGTPGKVVEGLGLGRCRYSAAQIETATVNSIRNSFRTVTEI